MKSSEFQDRTDLDLLGGAVAARAARAFTRPTGHSEAPLEEPWRRECREAETVDQMLMMGRCQVE